MDVVKRTTYDLCLNAEEVKCLLPIIATGIKNSPPTGYDMKKASPVVEKVNMFIRSYGRDILEREGDEALKPVKDEVEKKFIKKE